MKIFKSNTIKLLPLITFRQEQCKQHWKKHGSFNLKLYEKYLIEKSTINPKEIYPTNLIWFIMSPHKKTLQAYRFRFQYMDNPQGWTATDSTD